MPDVLALVPYRLGTAGGQRTSIECWERPLREAGIRVDFATFESEALHRELHRQGRRAAKATAMAQAYWERLRLLRDVSAYDAVFVCREAALIGPEILERWLAGRRVPVIYWLDDPLFVRSPSHFNGWLNLLKCPAKIARICALADVVIVNGSPLRAFAERHASSVWVVPNLVDEAAYQPLAPLAGDPPVLGWIGSPSTAFNLDILGGPLARLAGRVPFRLHLVGAQHDRVGNVGCSWSPWSASTEVRELRRFDVGLVPLGRHPANPWKFNFKLAQYMALGIPPVATPVGSNPELVEHGVTGLLAEGPHDWVRHLEELSVNQERRQEMGAAAARFAAGRFTVAANAERIVAAFRSAMEAGPGHQRARGSRVSR